MKAEEKKVLHDLIAKYWFNLLFGYTVQEFQETPEFSSIDYIITATTGQQIFLEFKILSGELNKYYYNTIIEEQKINTFKALQDRNKDSKCVYLVYTKEGLISYNISQRIQKKSIELNLYKKLLKFETFGSEKNRIKLISSLSYQPDMYGDKLIVFDEKTRKKLRYYDLIFQE